MSATPTTPAQEQYPFRRPGYFSHLPPALDHATVGDVAQGPLLIVPARTPLRSIARSMAANRVHAVVVRDAPHGFHGWGVVTDATLVDAIADGRLDATAGEVATATAVTAGVDQLLLHGVHLMKKGATTHLLVLDGESRDPVGIVSALDVAAAWAWGVG